MSDYKQTRDAAGIITSRYSKMLQRLSEDFEDEMVIVSLMKYYNLCCEPNKDEGGHEIDQDLSILEAIERILEDYLNEADYNAWILSVKGKIDK